MKRFVLIAIFPLILFIMITACTHNTNDTNVEEASEDVLNIIENSTLPNTGTEDIDTSSGINDYVPSNNNETSADNSEVDSLIISFYGLGSVEYSFSNIRVEDNWVIANIPSDRLATDRTLTHSDKILLASISVRNIDVQSDEELAKEALINRFHITTEQLIYEHSNITSNGEPGPAGAISVEPVYFDNAYTENGILSLEKYFQYELPSIGSSVDYIIGWVITEEMASALTSNQLYVQDNTSGEYLLIRYE